MNETGTTNPEVMEMKARDETWEYLTEAGIATEAELQLVTSMNGHNKETLSGVLYVRTGYRSIEQIEEMEEG